MHENFNTTCEIPPILFNIKKFNDTSIELTWNNKSNKNISNYVIIKYVNNDGPYLTLVNSNSNRHVIDNIKNNVLYKIGIVSIDNNNPPKISNINKNIKQFTFSIFNDTPEVKYINSFKNNIYCDPKGQHRIIGSKKNCPKNNNSLIATHKLNKDGQIINYFNDELHTNLMNNLNKPSEDNIKFELKI